MTVEDYLAQGGTITRCPTVYLLPVTGAAPIRSGISERDDESHMRWKNGPGRARGTANAAKRARKLSVQTARHNARNKATAAERCAMIRRSYDAGITVGELAATHCLSVSRVKKLLRTTGVSFKALPGAKRGGPRPLVASSFDAVEMVRLYVDERMSVNNVARHMRCSNITVRRACAAAGVTRVQGRKPFSAVQTAELEARKAEARKLRAEGMSYKAIGEIMGRNHETIRCYCDDDVAAKRAAKGRAR